MTVPPGGRRVVERLAASESLRDQAVLALATLLAPAPFLEPELIRAVRLRLLPRLDVGTEADLWFSDLVADRGPAGITLHWDAVPPLLERLTLQLAQAATDDDIHELGDMLQRLHAGAPPLRVVQEQATWLAVSRGDGARAEIEALLATVTTTMQDDTRRSGIARWAHRNLRWMPKAVQSTEAAWELGLAASMETGEDAGLAGDVPDELIHHDFGDLLSQRDQVALPIVRKGDRVVVGETGDPDSFAVRVPRTDPRVVRLSWPDAGYETTVSVPAKQAVTVVDRPGPLHILGLSGLLYEIPAYARPHAESQDVRVFSVEILPAESGTSIWIEYGPRTQVHRILIDGGTAKTGQYLLRRLQRLPPGDRRFDLVILTHADANSSGGLVKMLSEMEGVLIDDFWFNGSRHLGDDGKPVTAPKNIERLQSLLDVLDGQNSWNAAFDGQRVAIREDGDLPTIKLRGGMTVTLLAPEPSGLDELRAFWSRKRAGGRSKAERATESRVPEEPDVESAPAKAGRKAADEPLSLTPADVRRLAQASSRGATSPVNESSIAVLLEHEGRRLLVAGDAPDAVLQRSLEQELRRTRAKAVELDAMVVPHNGSRTSLGRNLLAMLDCPRYLVSSIGKPNRHPHEATVARIVEFGGASPAIYFNYRSAQSEVWTNPKLRETFRYEPYYSVEAGASLAVDVRSAPARPQVRGSGLQITDIQVEGYERVVRGVDEESGLHALIAVHDTTLGPAFGGLRMWNYDSEDAALFDVRRLARGMTYKSAVAQTGLGGGKAVIIGESKSIKSEALYLAMGRFIDALGGRYITAEDVNTSVADLEVVRRNTKFVAGLSRESGGSGNPSPYTAYGVYLGMRAALGWAFDNDDPKGKTIAIQGVGAVGGSLAERLAEAGATIYVADRNQKRLDELTEKFGAKQVPTDEILTMECDLLAPCALGGILNDETIPALRTKVIAGAANNLLLRPEHGKALADRGVLYAPDYVINAGGIVNVSVEFRDGGYDEDTALRKIERIPQALHELWAISQEERIPPSDAADHLAKRILAYARSGS